MTWVVVARPIHYRRHGRNVSFAINPSARPQLVVHDFAAHIVAQQAGQIVPSPPRGSSELGPGGIGTRILQLHKAKGISHGARRH